MSAHSGRLRSAALALWTVLALGLSWRVEARDPLEFNIPRGPAPETLQRFGERTGLNIVFDFTPSRSIVTNAVQGRFVPADALAIMTKDTPLHFEFIDEETVTLNVAAPIPPVRKKTAAEEPTPGPQRSTDRRSLLSQTETVVIRSQRDRPSIGLPSSSLLTLSSENLQAFGFATTEDVIRTLPQVFGGGPTEDTRLGFEALTNSAFGTGINLRGLGAGSTLVLVNGHRLAGSGSEGIFTDISAIPLAIVDRIEILPDSSSSVYGADAVGGVVNFMLLDSLNGAQTDARLGMATRGALEQNRFSQLFGTKTRFGDALIAFDFYSRDSLRAADRAQGTSDLRAFGGNNFDVNQSNPATITAGANTWAVPGGQDGTHLTLADLLPGQQNLEDKFLDADLLPSQQRWSLYSSAKTKINEDIQLFADAFISQRDIRYNGGRNRGTFGVLGTHPFNPFHSPIQVSYDFTDDLGPLIGTIGVRARSFVLGTDAQLPAGWHLTATANFASDNLDARNDNAINAVELANALRETDPAKVFNPFGDGSHTDLATLDRLRGTAVITTDSQLWTADVTASHDLPGFQGSTGKLVTGADIRKQRFKSSLSTPGAFLASTRDMDRTVSAGFVAASIPLVGKARETSRANRLEATVAARYENYSDFGSIVSPRYGLTWAPVDGVAIRGTWSRSFRPPNLMDLDERSNIVQLAPVMDPRAPGGVALAVLQLGKNKNLSEERARSWTLGLDFDISAVPHLSAGVTYFNTTFTDRMDSPLYSTALLTDPSLANVVNANATPEQRKAACESAPLFGGTQETCLNTPIIADLRVRNSALMQTDGIDLLTEYVRISGINTTTFRLDGTYILSFREAQSRNLPILETVSTQNHPIDLRLRGSVDWQRGGFRTGALLNYFDNYRDLASTPQRRVGSWVTLDLNLSYAFQPNRADVLAGMTFSLGAENILDRDPPFLNNKFGIGYDQENGDIMGRMLSISARKNW